MASGKEHIVPWLIPPSWVWTTIGQITSIVAGRSPRGNHPEYFGGGIVWLKSGELKDGIVRKSAQTITRTGLASMGASVLPRGTICIACSGPASGKLGILRVEAATNQAVSGILPSKHVISEYLYCFLELQRPILIASTKHRTQQHISLAVIRGLPLPLPPITEQRLVTREIRQRLARVVAWKRALQSVRRELNNSRAKTLKIAFEGWIAPTEAKLAAIEGRLFESADRFLQRIVEERRILWEARSLSARASTDAFPSETKWTSVYIPPVEPKLQRRRMRLPEGWSWATVDQLCSRITQGWDIQPPYQASGFPLLSPRNIQDGYIDFSGAGFISEDTLKSYLQRCSPAKNDILIVREGSRKGRALIVGSEGPFAIPMAIMLLRPIADPLFVLYWVWSPLGQRWIRRRAGRAKAAHFRLTSARRMPIPFPPENEQHRIVHEVARWLAPTQRLAALIDRLHKCAEQLRPEILQRAFEGKLVLEDSSRSYERY